jgi:hypothetical protein
VGGDGGGGGGLKKKYKSKKLKELIDTSAPTSLFTHTNLTHFMSFSFSFLF